MQIENRARSMTVGALLKDFADLLQSQHAVDMDVKVEPADMKGELILGIFVGVGINLASSAMYDLLKVAIRRHASSLKKGDVIHVNGVAVELLNPDSDTTLKDLLSARVPDDSTPDGGDQQLPPR